MLLVECGVWSVEYASLFLFVVGVTGNEDWCHQTTTETQPLGHIVVHCSLLLKNDCQDLLLHSSLHHYLLRLTP